MTFRKLQAILDLQSTALHLLDSFNQDLVSHEMQLRAQLKNLWANRVHRWTLEIPENARAPLVEFSCSPEKDPQRFLFSTCMLLLDRFSRPDRGGDFLWEWQAFEENYSETSAPIRAAIMNGFWTGRQYGLVSDMINPTPQQRTSSPEHDVIPPLLAIAKAMTPEELNETATADYGCNIDRHAAALRRLLSTSDCRFPKGEAWYPAEVVELVSHVPGDVGFFEPCTAIVLINAIYSGDDKGDAEYSWRANHNAYLKLASLHRIPFLAAFRHLHETRAYWDPYNDQFWPERLPVANFLPWLPEQMPALA